MCVVVVFFADGVSVVIVKGECCACAELLAAVLRLSAVYVAFAACVALVPHISGVDIQ